MTSPGDPPKAVESGAPKRSYWRETLIGLLLLVVLVQGAVIVTGIFLEQYHSQKKVTDIAGPAGSGKVYELWYSRNGNLTFRPAVDNPLITYYDYYGSLSVKNVNWIDDSHVVLTMDDGTRMDIVSLFEIDSGFGEAPAGVSNRKDNGH